MRRNTLLPALLGWATVSGYDADLLACFYPDIWPVFSSALTLGNATRWATALRAAGGDVFMTERVGAHGDAFWQAEFPLMVAWGFVR